MPSLAFILPGKPKLDTVNLEDLLGEQNANVLMRFRTPTAIIGFQQLLSRSPVIEEHFQSVWVKVILAQLAFFVPFSLQIYLDLSDQFRIGSTLCSFLIFSGLVFSRSFPIVQFASSAWDNKGLPLSLLLVMFFLMGIGFGAGMRLGSNSNLRFNVAQMKAVLFVLSMMVVLRMRPTLLTCDKTKRWFWSINLPYFIGYIVLSIVGLAKGYPMTWEMILVSILYFVHGGLDTVYILYVRMEQGKVDQVFDALIFSIEFLVLQLFNVLIIKVIVVIYLVRINIVKYEKYVQVRKEWD